jgi:hypothetical protein
MDKKIKRNITIIGIVFIVLFIGIVALAQYGASYSKNNPTITVNSVVGVNNVVLPNSFQPTGIDQPGNDTYHNDMGDVVLYYTNTSSHITFLNVTDIARNMPSIELSPLDQEMNITKEYKTIGGIKGIITTSTEKNTADFDFVINNKKYVVEYDIGGEEGVSILLSTWLKASGYIQSWNYPTAKSTSIKTSANISNNQPTTFDGLNVSKDKIIGPGEVAPYHDGWDKQDYVDHGYRFSDPNAVG